MGVVFKNTVKESPIASARDTNSRNWFYYEEYSRIEDAISREKQLKGWVRAKKIALIESVNSSWRELDEE